MDRAAQLWVPTERAGRRHSLSADSLSGAGALGSCSRPWTRSKWSAPGLEVLLLVLFVGSVLAAVLAHPPDHQCDHDHGQDDERAASAHGLLDLGVGRAGEVAGGDHGGPPENATGGVVGEELGVPHAGRASQGWHDGPEE